MKCNLHRKHKSKSDDGGLRGPIFAIHLCGDANRLALPQKQQEIAVDTQVQIAYMSRAALVFTQAAFDEMLRAARTHNLSAGISGLLLYKCGYFLQVLEGPVARVDALYDRIRQDPRHTKVQLLMRRENAARQFKTWSMAFVEADSMPTPGLDELLIQVGNNVPASRSSKYISAIIADFKNNDYNPRPIAKTRPVVAC